MIAVWLRLISPIWQQMGRATSYQMPMTSHCTNCHHHEACTKLKTGFNILIAAIFESNLLASIIASTAAAGEWCAEFWKCQQKCHNVFLFSSHLYLFPSKSAHMAVRLLCMELWRQTPFPPFSSFCEPYAQPTKNCLMVQRRRGRFLISGSKKLPLGQAADAEMKANLSLWPNCRQQSKDGRSMQSLVNLKILHQGVIWSHLILAGKTEILSDIRIFM